MSQRQLLLLCLRAAATFSYSTTAKHTVTVGYLYNVHTDLHCSNRQEPNPLRKETEAETYFYISNSYPIHVMPHL